MQGRGSPTSDEFIREVNEAVRQDQWLSLWQRYGSYLVAAALAIVIGSALGVGWRSYQEGRRQDEAQRFAEASRLLQDQRPGDAASAFAGLAGDAGTGYGVLAQLRAAQAHGAAGDAAAKAAALGQLGETGAALPLYRELARLLAIQQTLDSAEPAGLIAELDQIAASNQPWRYSALELKALAQLKANDSQGARATLQGLTEDPATPPDMTRRAAELLATLGGPLAAGAPQGEAERPTGRPQAAAEPDAEEATR
jgi:hypothetical protein